MYGVEITIFDKGKAHKIKVSEEGVMVDGELYYWRDIEDHAITTTTNQDMRIQLEGVD